jgi:cytochrome b558/566 subunit A
MPDTVNLVPGNTYDVAFAVWIGKAGETTWDKSISPSFVPLTISISPPKPSVSVIPSAVVIVAAIGIVIAIVVIGLVYYSIRRRAG